MVFITGAHGLVGSALARACIARGDRVVVLRRRAQPASALVLEGTEAACTVVDGDLLADGLLARVIAEHDVETVFHLAAQPVVAAAQRDPAATFDVNVRGTWLLLDACARHGVARTVVASTFQGQEEPESADGPSLVLRQPYALTKACADLIARSWWHAHELPVATARCSNVYGPDRNGSRLIPAAMAAALHGEDFVIDSDGSARRDFVFVDDVAAAYLAIADAIDDGHAGKAFNVGSGTTHSVLDVAELVCAAAGTGARPVARGGASGIDQAPIDYSALQAATGWAPDVELPDGIARTIDWYRRYPDALTAASR